MGAVFFQRYPDRTLLRTSASPPPSSPCRAKRTHIRAFSAPLTLMCPPHMHPVSHTFILTHTHLQAHTRTNTHTHTHTHTHTYTYSFVSLCFPITHPVAMLPNPSVLFLAHAHSLLLLLLFLLSPLCVMGAL